jgi:hypothetical protein
MNRDSAFFWYDRPCPKCGIGTLRRRCDGECVTCYHREHPDPEAPTRLEELQAADNRAAQERLASASLVYSAEPYAPVWGEF